MLSIGTSVIRHPSCAIQRFHHSGNNIFSYGPTPENSAATALADICNVYGRAGEVTTELSALCL